MLSDHIAKAVRQFERRYIPEFRRSKLYRLTRWTFLIPLGLLVLVERLVLFAIDRLSGEPQQLKLSNIINGWANLAKTSPKIEALALKRANMCAHCPAAIFSGAIYATVIDHKTVQVRGMSCQDCNCPLSAKVRSVNDSCPRGKW